MVRALLDGRKTQTRRVLKAAVPEAPAMDAIVHEPKHPAPYLDAYCSAERQSLHNPRGMGTNWCWWTRDDRCGPQFKVGYAPGDLLWVRETFSFIGGDGVFELSQARMTGRYEPLYRADEGTTADRWWSSIHMPREFSRLTLTVTGVRVERLQAISEEDCVAEGAFVQSPRPYDHGQVFVHRDPDETWHSMTPRAWYHELWDSINGAGAWDANPWIVALTFSVAKRNIDAMRVAA